MQLLPCGEKHNTAILMHLLKQEKVYGMRSQQAKNVLLNFTDVQDASRHYRHA